MSKTGDSPTPTPGWGGRRRAAVETTYHTVCNDCKQVIDGKADEHIREVTDTPAYDETVPDELACTLCGATRPLDATVE